MRTIQIHGFKWLRSHFTNVNLFGNDSACSPQTVSNHSQDQDGWESRSLSLWLAPTDLSYSFHLPLSNTRLLPFSFFSFFFFFFFFLLFRAETSSYGGSRLRVKLKLQLPAYATATAMPDPSHTCNLHHARGNARSLTHWARPGIKPSSSWY